MTATATETWRLAIDFGTSSTAAAMSSADGRVSPLVLESGSFTMPSGVVVLDGQVHTGMSANRLVAVSPSGYEPTPKRRLGEDEILLDGATFSPLTLIGAILDRVYQAAVRQHNARPPSEVVLTHPEAWRGHRLERLREAAVVAGIPGDRIRMISEPVAAAWHYTAADLSSMPPDALLGVLDFGGGTLDIALLRYERRDGIPRFVVVDQDGIDTLGGHDFDTKLVEWTLDQLRSDDRAEMANALAATGSDSLYDRLVVRDQVRQAKHALSEHASAHLVARADGREWVGTATRDEFVALIGDDLDRAVLLLERLLGRNGVAAERLHTLYLTGGSTHIPELHHRLERIVPGRLATLDDPKQVTALGALRVPATSTPWFARVTAEVQTPAQVPGGQAPAPESDSATSPATAPGPEWVPAQAPVPADPPPPPTPRESGELPPQEPVTSRSRKSGRGVWVSVAAVVGVCAVVGIAAALANPGGGGGGGGGAGDETPTLDADALIAVLPAGFTGCDPLETTASSVTVSCYVEDGGPTTSAVVQQHADAEELDATFDAWTDPANLTADAACPDGPDGVYTFSDEARGRFTCGTGVDGPQLIWTQTDIGVLVVAYGDPASPPGDLYEWFLGVPLLSQP